MELKCYSCRNYRFHCGSVCSTDYGDNHDYHYCGKNHWDSDPACLGLEPEPTEDLWEDCADYVSTKQQIYVLMGLPGAGKTTWAKKRIEANNNTIVIGRDGIRYMLSAGYSYKSSKKHQDFVYKTSLYLIENGLLEGFDIVIDQLSLTAGQRYDTEQHIREFCRLNELYADVHLIHLTEEEENVQRRLDSDMRWGDREYYENLIKNLKESTEEVEEWEMFDSYSQVDKNGDMKKIW